MNKKLLAILAIAVAAIVVISAVVIVSNPVKTAPSAALNLQATRGDAKVTASWQAPSANGTGAIEGYSLYRGTSASTLNVRIDVGMATGYQDVDLTNGVTYYYQVAARNSAGEGARSATAQATPSSDPATAPSVPLSFAATVGQSKVKLDWTAPINNGGSPLTSYYLSYAAVGGGTVVNLTVGLVLTYTVDGLGEDEYQFTLAAANAVGRGPSANVTAQPQPKTVESLVFGYVTTAGNNVGLGDMGVYLFRNTMTSESLIGVDSEGNYVPRLADSWETQDSRTWTFHLSHNATWHDGMPFTAKDVLFTYNYTMDKKPWGMNDAAFMKDIANISAPDHYTVIITMKAADSNLLVNMRIGMAVFPEHIFKFVADPMTYNERNGTIGTGPYIFQSLDPTARLLKYSANPNYYRGGSPSVHNVTIRFYSNADSMMLALLKGDIDVTFGWGAGIDYFYVPKVLADPELSIALNPSAALRAMNFNCQQYPFDNATFRKAISYALDYVQLRDIIMGGYGSTPNAGLIPSCMDGYVATTPLVRNVTEANRILALLGFVDIDSDGYREMPNGTKFQPQLLTSTATHFTRSAEIIEKNLREVGIDVRVKATANYGTEKKLRQYGMALSGTSQAGTYAWAGFYTTQVDMRGGLADCLVNDPVFYALIDQIRNASTPELMQAAAQALQQYYADQLPSLALYWFDMIQPYNHKYVGYSFDPQFGTVVCYETFYNLRRA